MHPGRLPAAFRDSDHVPYSSKLAGVRPGLPSAAQASILTFISTWIANARRCSRDASAKRVSAVRAGTDTAHQAQLHLAAERSRLTVVDQPDPDEFVSVAVHFLTHRKDLHRNACGLLPENGSRPRSGLVPEPAVSSHSPRVARESAAPVFMGTGRPATALRRPVVRSGRIGTSPAPNALCGTRAKLVEVRLGIQASPPPARLPQCSAKMRMTRGPSGTPGGWAGGPRRSGRSDPVRLDSVGCCAGSGRQDRQQDPGAQDVHGQHGFDGDAAEAAEGAGVGRTPGGFLPEAARGGSEQAAGVARHRRHRGRRRGNSGTDTLYTAPEVFFPSKRPGPPARAADAPRRQPSPEIEEARIQ